MQDRRIEAQMQGRLVGLGGQGEAVGGQVDVAELIVIGGALGIEFQGLLVVLSRLGVIAQVVLGLGQHVIGGIIVAIFQDRFHDAGHVLPLLFGRIDFAQGLAGLDMIRGRFKDFLQLRCGRVVFAGIAVRPGKMQAVTGFGFIGIDRLGKQLGRLVVLTLEQGAAALGEEFFGGGCLGLGPRIVGLGLVGGRSGDHQAKQGEGEKLMIKHVHFMFSLELLVSLISWR